MSLRSRRAARVLPGALCAAALVLTTAPALAAPPPAVQPRGLAGATTNPTDATWQPVQASPREPLVPAKSIAWTIADPAFAPLRNAAGTPTTRVLYGVDHGASYRIEVPLQGWNGDVVFWEHGYRGTGTTLTVDNPGYGLREHYIANGYAWAASSYSANRYDIEAGVESTERLAKLFDRLVAPGRPALPAGRLDGRPRHRRPARASAGRRVVGRGADVRRHGRPGAVRLLPELQPGCAGARRCRRLPDPGRLPDERGAPHQVGARPAQQRDTRRHAPDRPRGGRAPDAHDGARGWTRPGADAAFDFWERQSFLFGILGNQPGGTVGVAPGNVATNATDDYPDVYAFADGDTLDQRIERVAPAHQARRSGTAAYVPDITGTFDVPVLSIQHPRRLLRALLHGAGVRRRGRAGGHPRPAGAAGDPGAGHCEFTPQEAIAQFDDLVRWVEDGVKPAGDDVLDTGGRGVPVLRLRLDDAHQGPDTRRFYPVC